MESSAIQVETVETKPTPAPEASGFESEAFSVLYTEHARAVYYLALRFLGDPTQAEDATHDVFVKAYRKLGQFRGEAAVRTWLYRITINHCQNLRQTWHQRHIVATDNDSLWETAPSPTDSPLRVLEIKELGERIQRALDALSEEYRLLLLLVADERMSYDEVAELTQQTADAVRGKLHRARKAFTVAFKKTDGLTYETESYQSDRGAANGGAGAGATVADGRRIPDRGGTAPSRRSAG